MNPCFICRRPASSFRSLAHLTAPPCGPHDAVPICPCCQDHWSAALLAIVRADLMAESGHKPPANFDRNNHHHEP
jgi:hypothetical protein